MITTQSALTRADARLSALHRAATYLPALTLDAEIEQARRDRAEISRALTSRSAALPIAEIARLTAEEFGVGLDDMRGKRKVVNYVWPRHAAMYLAIIQGYFLREVGEYFGGRDHSTIINGREKTKIRIETEPGFGQRIERLIRVIEATG
jgi:chromosomal replication initiator protein